jgi:hypothetical protein
MLSILPAILLRALTRRAFRVARALHKSAARAEARELAEGGYYLHPGVATALIVVCLVLAALAEGA